MKRLYIWSDFLFIILWTAFVSMFCVMTILNFNANNDYMITLDYIPIIVVSCGVGFNWVTHCKLHYLANTRKRVFIYENVMALLAFAPSIIVFIIIGFLSSGNSFPIISQCLFFCAYGFLYQSFYNFSTDIRPSNKRQAKIMTPIVVIMFFGYIRLTVNDGHVSNVANVLFLAYGIAGVICYVVSLIYGYRKKVLAFRYKGEN